MGISDKIEQFIHELLKNEDDWLELKRNEMAQIFECVPSQINYVIQTRFNPEKGYMVESRRGGGGFIRIKKVCNDENVFELLNGMSSIGSGDAASMIKELYKNNKITAREADIMFSALSDKSLSKVDNKNVVRSDILKSMILALLNN